ncbi:hypothetical protein [Actinoplanes couchii]|nr:hypothetical protein [Actinoplanes couchii]MDR6318588.1 hypothetical protein [Actinoplanes couchii]
MPKVKLSADVHDQFSRAAEAGGMTVRQWLTAAGRRQVLIDTVVRDQPGARVLQVPVDAVTGAHLYQEATRTGTSGSVYALRLLREVVTVPAIDPERLWADILAAISAGTAGPAPV